DAAHRTKLPALSALRVGKWIGAMTPEPLGPHRGTVSPFRGSTGGAPTFSPAKGCAMRRVASSITFLLASALLAPAQTEAPKKRDLRAREGGLHVGDVAPDFSLTNVEGKNPVTLSKLK